jgi:hypothetical protein
MSNSNLFSNSNDSGDIVYTRLTEKSQNILNNLLNYTEKENPINDLSFKWYKYFSFFNKKTN